jgi:hypothetical protein
MLGHWNSGRPGIGRLKSGIPGVGGQVKSGKPGMLGKPGIGISGNFGGQRSSMMPPMMSGIRPARLGRFVKMSSSRPPSPIMLAAFIAVMIVR